MFGAEGKDKKALRNNKMLESIVLKTEQLMIQLKDILGCFSLE